MRRIAVALLSVAALAACGSNDPSPDPVAGPISAAPASGEPAAVSSTGSSPAASATASPRTESTSAGTPRCHTADLKLTVTADPGGGAAGRHGEFLTFANASSHPCTLYGFPGVSFVAGDQGTQVGDAFTRGGDAKQKITLTAGAKARATIVLVTPENFDAADCKPVQARGYRVYPPDETASIFVSRPQKACSAKGTGVGEVEPITKV